MGMIETVNELATALGGTSKMAALLNVTPQAVSKMKRKGYVPPRHVLRVQELAKRKRWKLADALFENGDG